MSLHRVIADAMGGTVVPLTAAEETAQLAEWAANAAAPKPAPKPSADDLTAALKLLTGGQVALDTVMAAKPKV